MTSRLYFPLLGLLFSLAACDGSGPNKQPATGGGQSAPPPPPPQLAWVPCADMATAAEPSLTAPAVLPGGLYWGVASNESTHTTVGFEAWLGDDGRFRFLSHDYDVTVAQLTGDLSILGNTFVGEGSAYTIADSSKTTTGHSGDVTVTGVVAERDRISGEWSTSTGETACFEAGYDSFTYEQAPSLASLGNSWTSLSGIGQSKSVMTIDDDGSFSEQAADGCNTVGHISQIDDRFNLYEVQSTTSGCTAAGNYSGFVYLCPCGIPGWYLILSIDDGSRAFRTAYQNY